MTYRAPMNVAVLYIDLSLIGYAFISLRTHPCASTSKMKLCNLSNLNILILSVLYYIITKAKNTHFALTNKYLYRYKVLVISVERVRKVPRYEKLVFSL